MTKKGCVELVRHLSKWYPRQFPAHMDRDDIAERAQGFYDVLDVYEDAVVMDACRNLLKSLSFCPTVAEIVEAADAVKAQKETSAGPDKFVDEEGYRYERQGGQMVCAYRPPVRSLADPELQAWMDEKRRQYAEGGAPYSYTMRQVQELAEKKGIKLEVQDDMSELARLAGGKVNGSMR